MPGRDLMGLPHRFKILPFQILQQQHQVIIIWSFHLLEIPVLTIYPQMQRFGPCQRLPQM